MKRLDLTDGIPAILLDAIGAAAFIAEPADELGIVLDLGGLQNRPPSLELEGEPERLTSRYLMSPAQGAELVVAILNAARAGHDPRFGTAFLEALEAMQ